MVGEEQNATLFNKSSFSDYKENQFDFKTVSWDMQDPEFKFAFCKSTWQLMIIWMVWASYGYMWNYFVNWIWMWQWPIGFYVWDNWFFGYYQYWTYALNLLWAWGVLYFFVAYDPMGEASEVCKNLDMSNTEWQTKVFKSLIFGVSGGVLAAFNPLFVLLGSPSYAFDFLVDLDLLPPIVTEEETYLEVFNKHIVSKSAVVDEYVAPEE